MLNIINILFSILLPCSISYSQAQSVDYIEIPYLDKDITIDGDLTEWKEYAFHDGVWDIHRLKYTPWYQPSRNRLTDHGNEPTSDKDLSARYYMAWDSVYLYLGAEVIDNVNDIIPHKPEPYRWYYKDCVAWFIEAPGDTANETFGQGDNAFCFVVDPKKPFNGAWWRHGAPDTTYLEEPVPSSAVDYEIKMGRKKKDKASFVLEAKVNMAMTLGRSDPAWKAPSIGDIYRLMIVHCDPDGGDYGGHLLIYGKGDDDETWTEVKLGGSITPVLRKKQ
ncbi:MAG: hypothetical protein KDE26_04625 [Bacteroidetes bacterium]|nr:hypothetical protein [Bacteroidota bacterium]